MNLIYAGRDFDPRGSRSLVAFGESPLLIILYVALICYLYEMHIFTASTTMAAQSHTRALCHLTACIVGKLAIFSTQRF